MWYVASYSHIAILNFPMIMKDSVCAGMAHFALGPCAHHLWMARISSNTQLSTQRHENCLVAMPKLPLYESQSIYCDRAACAIATTSQRPATRGPITSRGQAPVTSPTSNSTNLQASLIVISSAVSHSNAAH